MIRPPRDWIREALVARAEELGLAAYGIAKKCEPPLDTGTVRRYFAGRARLNSEYVGRICKVLGMTISQTAPDPSSVIQSPLGHIECPAKEAGPQTIT